MRYLALFFSLLFIVFALVQINDPDPWLWVPIYLVPAVVSFLVFRGRYPRVTLWIGAVVFLIAGIYLFPGGMADWVQAEQQSKSLEMGLPFIEEAREAMGLLVVFLAFAIYLVADYTRRPARLR